MKNENVGEPAVRSDLVLIDALRNDDSSASAELYRRHVKSALAAAYRVAPTRDPEDIVSEAFIRVFEIIARGAGPREAFRPYLYQVIRNVAYNLPSTANSPLELSEDIPAPETPEGEVGLQDRNTSLASAFHSMPERWQAVIWYSTVEQLPHRDIAPLLGTSPGNVAQIALRARRRLRELLRQDGITQVEDQTLGRSLAVVVLGGTAAGAIFGSELLPLSAPDSAQALTEAATSSSTSPDVAAHAAIHTPLALKLLVSGGVTGITLLAAFGLNALWSGPSAPAAPPSSSTQSETSTSTDFDADSTNETEPSDQDSDETASNSGAGPFDWLTATNDDAGPDPSTWGEIPWKPPVVRGPK